MNSNSKGKRGEREIAAEYTDAGWPARRAQQYAGEGYTADVLVDDLPLHIEVKRTQRWDAYGWTDQAKRDAHPMDIPVVHARRNHCEWLVILPLEEWKGLLPWVDWDGFLKARRVDCARRAL